MWDVAFDDESIGASTTETSQRIYLSDGRNIHAFQYKVTGDGTVDIVVETSIDGLNWVDNGIKAKGATKTSGPGGNGGDIVPLVIKPSDFIRFKATETGGANSVTLNLWMLQK